MSGEYLYNGIWNKKDNTIFFLAQGIDESKEYEHTLVYFDDKKEWTLDKYFEWNSVSVDMDLNDNIVVIGIDGDFAVKIEGSYKEGQISEYPTITNSYRSNSILYIVGMSSVIYKYNDDMSWSLFNSGVGSDEDFSSINGNLNKMYVVGFDGVCYQLTNNIWEEESLPTNENLKSVFVSEDDITFITGQNGALLVGIDNSWQVVEHDYMLDDLWSVLIFQDVIYVAGNNIIYELSLNENQWKLTPLYAWEIEKKGVFSDMFIENGNRKRLWVMSEKGFSFLQDNKWERLY